MDFDRTGIILYTINYKECVKFYREILELRILFETKSLTCFEFGDSYLMVEIDDESDIGQIEAGRIKTCLRMHVPNVRERADQIVSKNIDVNYREYSWGTVAKFFDPDGNLCAFKDSDTFEKQILAYYKA